MIIKFIKSGLNLHDGAHPHFVREATFYDAYSITIETSKLKDSADLISNLKDYTFLGGHEVDEVKFCVSEDAQMKADDGHLQEQLVKSFTVFELSDGAVVYTDLPVYVCNDAGKTIDSYNTG